MKKDFDILVIDDEKIVLDAVSKICVYQNLSIDTATDGTEAVKKVIKNEYGVILCDIMMPQMDGFEFLSDFKKRKKSTPIVITSGFSTNENAVKAIQEGALDFISKPFTFDELTATLSRAFTYWKLNESGKSELSIDGGTHSLYVACPPQYLRLGYLSWIKLEADGTYLAGIVNLFLELIDNIKEIRFTEQDEKVFQGTPFLTIIDASDREHNVLCPLSGKIIEINDKVVNNVNLLGKDPYFEGWLYKIIPSKRENEINKLTPCSSDRV